MQTSIRNCGTGLRSSCRGWLLGPVSWNQLPDSAVVSRRFPITKSEKVRPIDDFEPDQLHSYHIRKGDSGWSRRHLCISCEVDERPTGQ